MSAPVRQTARSPETANPSATGAPPSPLGAQPNTIATSAARKDDRGSRRLSAVGRFGQRGALDRDFDDFYRAEANGVYRALALALADADLAQEATDEGLARAYQRWHRIGRYDNPAGWVYRVGLNWARSRIRKTGREVLTGQPISLPPTNDNIDPDLRRALAALSLDARAVVVLRYLLEWSTADTATALDIAPGTVKSRLARALAQLESILEERP